jgi:hypothetical protein
VIKYIHLTTTILNSHTKNNWYINCNLSLIITKDLNNKMLSYKTEVTAMREIKENLIVRNEVIRGLCSTCNNSPTCFYHLRNGKRVVCYCELFDNYISPSRVGEFSKITKLNPEPSTHTTIKDRFNGLCINCENVETCAYPKPEGGVWHCEEYC